MSYTLRKNMEEIKFINVNIILFLLTDLFLKKFLLNDLQKYNNFHHL